MWRPKERINRNRLIGIIALIVSIMLLGVFLFLVLTNKTLTNTLYSTAVFAFVLGMLGLITSLETIFYRG